MNLLDIRTILFSYTLTNAISAFVMTSLWRQNRRRSPELVFWLIDFIMQFVGILLLSLRGVLPDFLTLTLPNILLVGGTLLLLLGLERYTRRESSQWFNYLYMAGFVLIHLFFVYIQPSLMARTINNSFGLFVFCSQCAWLLIRRVDRPMRQDTYKTGLVFILFSFVSLSRILVDLIFPPGNDLFKLGQVDTLMILISQMLYISLTFSLFLLVNRRLTTTMENELAEKKRADEALRETELQNSIILETALDGFWLVEPQTQKIIAINDAYCRMSGYNREELLQMTISQFEVLEQYDDIYAHIKRIMNQTADHFETIHRRKDGSQFPVDVSVQYMAVSGKMFAFVRDITERKRLEEGIRENQRLLSELIEHNPAIIFAKDREGRYELVNQKWEQDTGIQRQFAIGKKDEDLFREDVSGEFRANDAIVMETGNIVETEEVVESASTKSLRYYITIKFPLADNTNRIRGVCGISTDITGRKLAEQKIRESEEQLKAVIEGSRMGFSDWNIQTGVIRRNERWAEMLGYSLQDVESSFKQWADLIHPDDLTSSQQALQDHLDGKTPFHRDEYRLRAKDGSYRWILDQGAVLEYDSQGRPLRMTATHTDITERKQVEQLLQESEQRLQFVLKGSQLGFWDWNLETNEVKRNERWAEMLGYRLDEIDFTVKQWIDFIHPDDQAIASQSIQDHIEGKTPLHRLEYRMRTKDGQYKWILDQAQAVKWDSSRRVIRMSGTHTDITERKQAEEAIKTYSEKLEALVGERTRELRDAQEKLIRHEKLSVLGQMASSVGHELRNPLGVINSAVYYLKLIQPDVDENVKKYLGIIGEEVQNSEKIIADLLDFARIRSADREPASVSDLIQQTLERFPAPENVDVNLEIPPDLPKVYVDPRHLTQVFGNLIANACQSMPDGGTLAISAKRSTVDGQAFVDVGIKDTGVGIAPENLKKLFEPLFTTKAKGIGLGLAVCQKLVEANRGRIEVQSEAGRGSIFTVYLPVVNNE